VAAVTAQAGEPGRAHRLADDAEALARTITDPDYRGKAFADLVEITAYASNLDRAGRLLARALIMDPPGIWWVRVVSHFFPSLICDACDVLSDAYATTA
jgi:hypothetical protein